MYAPSWGIVFRCPSDNNFPGHSRGCECQIQGCVASHTEKHMLHAGKLFASCQPAYLHVYISPRISLASKSRGRLARGLMDLGSRIFASHGSMDENLLDVPELRKRVVW